MSPGNPYASNSIFVGREEELADVLEYLGRGDSALLLGGRRCGKTSLIRKIGDVGRRFFRFDADAWDLTSESHVIRSFGEALETPCETRADLERALTRLAPLAIAVDEADRVLAEPWAGSFLSFLRYIDEKLRQQVAFLLAGGPVLGRYKNPDDKGSPPLNTARRVYLQPLGGAARRSLAAPLEDACDERVFDAAAGHPWILTRLMEQLWKRRTWEDAVERVFEEALGNFEVWKRQLGDQGVEFLQKLPGGGLRKVALRNEKRWRPYREASILARSLCLVRVEDDVILPGPRLFLDWLGAPTRADSEWDLAISYASEDVALARAIWSELTEEFRVFFAPQEAAYLWGEDLTRLLPHLYGTQSTYVLVLSSEAYLKKHWTKVEYAATSRRLGNRLLLVHLGSLPKKLPKGLVYRAGSSDAMVTLVRDLKRKLRTSPQDSGRSRRRPAQ